LDGATESTGAASASFSKVKPWRWAFFRRQYWPMIFVASSSQSGSASKVIAWVLNCQPHDVPILVAVRLLKPLGNPPPNSVKFFAASELLEQVKDRTWLAKVTNALNQHWQKRNAAKKNGHSFCSGLPSTVEN